MNGKFMILLVDIFWLVARKMRLEYNHRYWLKLEGKILEQVIYRSNKKIIFKYIPLKDGCKVNFLVKFHNNSMQPFN